MDGAGFDDYGNPIAAPAPPTLNTQPTTITPAVPTAANGFGTGVTNPYVSDYDKLAQQRYQESQSPIDTNRIRKQKIAQFQAEIDATNQIYSNLIAKAQVEGQGRIGQSRAIAARSGLINQPRGEAQKEQVVSYNRGIEGDISARQQAAVSAIMTEAQNRADAEIAKREEAKRLGADQYLQYLAGTEERKATNAKSVLQSLLAQGLILEDIPADQFTKLANSLRMTPQELTSVYKGELATAKAAKQKTDAEIAKLNAEAAKAGQTILNEGDILVDAKGNVIARGNNKPITLPEGSVILNADGTVKYKNPKTVDPLEAEKFAFDQEYKKAQLNIDYQKLDIEQKKLLADGSSKPLTAEELVKFGNLPAGTTWDDIKGQSPVSKLSSEEKKLNSLAISAYDSLNTIKNKLFDAKGGINRNQIIGSGVWAREYGNAVNNLTDVIGRLRSGGAITSDEERRFKSLLPNAADSAATIKSKLNNIELMFKAIDPADSTNGIQSTDSLKNELINGGGSEGTNPKAPLSQVGPKTLASALVAKFKEGTRPTQYGAEGDECGYFVRQVAKSFGLDYARLGNTLKSKMAAVQKFGTSLANAGSGSVIVTKENPTFGHVAFIVGRNAQGFVVTESNFKQSNRISYGRTIPYNSPKIIGVINPTKVA